MKRLIVILALGLFAIALMTPVAAQFTAEPTAAERAEIEAPAVLPGQRQRESTPAERSDQPPSFGQRPAERPDLTEQRQETREARQELRAENSELRWVNAATRLELRLRWFDQRLASILNRAYARAEVMKSSGVDVTAIDASLANAERLLEDARADAATAVALLKEVDPSMSPDDGGITQVSTAIRTAHQSYSAVRQELLSTVRLMKAARGLTSETPAGEESNE